VFRAKLILMLAEGASFNTIKRQLQTTAPTIVRWKRRFRQYGLEGLDTYHPGQKPSVLTPALRARILSDRNKIAARAVRAMANCRIERTLRLASFSIVSPIGCV
jgi:transposase